MERNEDKGARLFSVVLSDRTGDHGHKLSHIKFKLNTGLFFSIVRVVKRWQRLPGVFMRLHLWRSLKPIWTQSWATGSRRPCLSGGFGVADLKRLLQTSTIL